MSYEFFTENQIRSRMFQGLRPDDSVVAECWRGYGTRIGKKQIEKYHFNREFDIAQFDRRATVPLIGSTMYELQLYGFEVKGYRKVKGKWITPAYASGIAQALVLLQQGADFAYVVLPEPPSGVDERLRELFSLCQGWCPLIGIMLSRADGSFWAYREAQRNPYTSPERKKTLLLRLISDGYMSNIRTPDWAKKHEF